MWEGVCRAEGNKGGKWDNCNSIINKIYLKNTFSRCELVRLFLHKVKHLFRNMLLFFLRLKVIGQRKNHQLLNII